MAGTSSIRAFWTKAKPVVVVVWRAIRWLLAAALVVYCAVGFLTNAFERCAEEITDGKVVETCGPPVLTDASVLAIAAVFVILVWPDISEVGLFGLSLKRRVEAAEEKATDAEKKTSELATELHLTRIEMAASATAVASAQQTVIITREALERAAENTPAKVEAFLRNDAEPLPRGDASPETSARGLELIRVWEELNERLGLRYGSRRSFVDNDMSRKLLHFREAFAEEIEIVRGVRNAVAHAKPVTAAEIEQALTVAAALDDALASF